jgi:hypothetical protein
MLTGSRFTTRGFPVDDIFLHNLALQEGMVFDFGDFEDRGDIFIFIFLLVPFYVCILDFTIKYNAYIGNMTLKKWFLDQVGMKSDKEENDVPFQFFANIYIEVIGLDKKKTLTRA